MSIPPIDHDLATVDEGIGIEFLGHSVGNYDFSAAAAAFFRELRQERLTLPFCDSCSLYLHPRREICPNCLADEVTSRSVSPSGALYSFSTMYATPFEAHQADTPYTVGIVTLDVGVSVFGRIDAPAESIAIGMPLTVDFGSSTYGLHFAARPSEGV